MDKSAINNASGVGLIEVLIALVILGVGLLGIAQLQVASMKFSHNALLYGQATSLAYDAFDRMRASAETATVATGASWPSTYTSSWYGNIGVARNAQCIDPTSTTTTCNANTMAQADIYDWAQKVSEALPNGFARISRTAGTGVNTYTVTISWQQRRTGINTPSATETLTIQGEI